MWGDGRKHSVSNEWPSGAAITTEVLPFYLVPIREACPDIYECEKDLVFFHHHHKSGGKRIFGNDPSAGSPTETLLRLLLPLNDPV